MQRFGADRSIKNKWVLLGIKELGIEVLNIAEDDIDELIALGVDLQHDLRFISANLISTKTGGPLLKPYVIKEIPVQGSEKKFRLGFLGLALKEHAINTEGKGYFWADPGKTAHQWVPELRQKCDFLIVLACMPSQEAVQLANENTDIDIIIDGFKRQWTVPPTKVNQSTIIYAEDEGKMLGELRFHIVREEKVDVNPINHVLTRAVKDDPEMATFISRAKEEITAERRSLADRKPSETVLPVPRADSPFVSSSHCISCHATAYAVWQHSKHAKAIEILKSVNREFDSSCVRCHTTGKGQVGGYEDLNRTPELANVQCEACHGPGRAHSANPNAFKMAKLDSTVCLQCHTKSNSPDFEFAHYWPKVKH